jgi:ribonuclease HI
MTGSIQVYTDSTYVISGATSWIHGWKRRGWKTADGKPVLNQDLWEELDGLVAACRGRLTWHYVRGHTGSPGNERCDEIAVAFSHGKPIELYRGPISAYPCEDILEIPEDTSLPERSPGSKPKRVGGFYLSYLDGRLERHAAWNQCQARVTGKSGALFKKVFSEVEAEEVRRRWGVGGSAKG